MVSPPEMASFEQFWPHYLRSHANRTTRLLHGLGLTAAAAALAAGATRRRRRWLWTVAPALALGPAWLGHWVVEGNRPAILRHPLWALRAAGRMARMMVAGTLSDELARVVAAGEHGEHGEQGTPDPPTTSSAHRGTAGQSPPRPSNGGGNGAARRPPPDPHSLN